MTSRIAVLASGSGTNLQALLDHLDALGDNRAGDVVLVATDRRDAGARARASARGVPTAVVETPTASGGRPLDVILRDHDVDLIALAGYLRLVPVEIVAGYRGRIVNVHPALLPAFGGAGMYGARVHQAVLDAGSTISGATVHFVDDAYDRGPVIAQWPVPVVPGDTAASLASRVLRVEHVLYPVAVNAVAAGRVTLAAGGTVQRTAGKAGGAEEPDDWAFCLTTSPGPQLANEIARAIGA